MKTCFSCLHFLGGDDWGLCCDVNDTLCYFDTEACENYEKVDSDEQLRRNKKLLLNENSISKILLKNNLQDD